jgi:hypothetical protein
MTSTSKRGGLFPGSNSDGPQRPCEDAVSTANLIEYARHLLQHAETYPKERLTRRIFRLAKLDLVAWFSNPDLADMCASTLVERRAQVQPVLTAKTLVIDAGAKGWPRPLHWCKDADFSSRDFERELAKARLRGFYHHDAPSWQIYDPIARFGVMSLSTPMGIPPWESTSPLRLFLHWAYASAKIRLIHAATLGIAGQGALLVGPSGSGKSGTTIAGLMHGLQSVGDDYVVVEQGTSVTAFPAFNYIKQDQEGLQRASLVSAEYNRDVVNWRGKYEIGAGRLSENGLVDRLTIKALLLPKIARLEQTTIERVGWKEAALALAPSAVFQLPGDTNEGFQIFASLVRRLPAFRLGLSEHPREIARSIQTFFAQGLYDAG